MLQFVEHAVRAFVDLSFMVQVSVALIFANFAAIFANIWAIISWKREEWRKKEDDMKSSDLINTSSYQRTANARYYISTEFGQYTFYTPAIRGYIEMDPITLIGLIGSLASIFSLLKQNGESISPKEMLFLFRVWQDEGRCAEKAIGPFVSDEDVLE